MWIENHHLIFRKIDLCERKKLEIRAAKQMLGIDGVKSRKEPLEYKPLQAIMQILDGGRR